MTDASRAATDLITGPALESATQMPGSSTRSRRRLGFGSLAPAASLMAWIYLYLIGLLGLWVVIVTTVAGWDPVVVTSGSMTPVLRVGDVVMIEEHPDDLVGQRSVVTFERGDDVITHRVFEVHPEERTYVTKGDANPTPDTDEVPVDSVVGVARLVVPFIGLPVVWLGTSNLAPLAAFAILSLAALGFAVRRASDRDGTLRAIVADRTSTVADQAIRRVRLLIGVMICSQYLIDGSRFTIDGLDIGPTRLLVLSLAWLGATNLISVRYPLDRHGWPVAIFQLTADTVLVVFMTTATGGSGIGWVLTAVPIIEAAVRFRLAGALVHWMLMAVLTIIGRIWVLERIANSATTTIDELEQLLDQMSVLLLVIVPGAFLAEQLLGDVLVQQRATREAVDRGRLLENVAELGYEVTKIGTALFDTLAESARSLGFDMVDVWGRPSGGEWSEIVRAGGDTIAGTGTLPGPDRPASGLRAEDLGHSEVMVDAYDADPEERAALARAGLAYLVRLTINNDDTLVVLRAAGRTGSSVDSSHLEALRLLGGQATVAMHNRDLVVELQELHSKLEHQALHDALTQLPNRAYFLRGLHRELDPERQAELPDGMSTIVLFLDLNGFKAVNDRLGHDAGDELLKVVAQRITKAVRSRGLVARLGGDEFTVLLPASSDTRAADVAGAIHDKLAEPISLQHDTVTVGTSIGMAKYQDEIDSSELLRRADAAMYAAKQSRSARRLSVYHTGLDDSRNNDLTEDLRVALATDRLHLVFQPLVSVQDRRFVGAEVLLRWTHPDLGAIGPIQILETAEKADRVAELNEWVMRNALNALARLPLSADSKFTLAINASPAELASPSFIRNIRTALEESGSDPARLVIELSERIVASGDDLDDVVGQLVDLGVGLSLDDFGQGKTSLGHLRRLPIRQLKLDSLLVRQACTRETDRVILRSVVELGHNLGFEVVAEGVETNEHMAAIIEANADLAQGFGLFRPMPADRLVALMDRRREFRPEIGSNLSSMEQPNFGMTTEGPQ